MNKLLLLIIEDDKDFQNSYSKQIKIFNAEQSEIFVEEHFETEVEGSKNYLLLNQIDAAIVDLKLGNQDTEYKGKEIIKIIKKSLRFPAFILTANPEVIESESNNVNDLFKIKVKGSEEAVFLKILEELKKIHLTGITKILNNKGVIEEFLNNIFWNHLSKSISNWINDESRDSDEKQKSLLRYTLIHMQEYIDEDVELYHPSEFYIAEPIKKNIFTGDIVSYEGNRFIVLTPSCDIVLRKDNSRNSKFVLFCKIKNLATEVLNYSNLTLNTGNNNDDKKRLNRFITNNSSQNFHFIPKSNNIEAGLIDFQDKITLQINEVNEKITNGTIVRKATVSIPFLKDIISRYSNYYSRQGSPDFDVEEIYKTLF